MTGDNPYLPPTLPSEPPPRPAASSEGERLPSTRTRSILAISIIILACVVRTLDDLGAYLFNAAILPQEEGLLALLQGTRVAAVALTVIAPVFYCIWLFRTAHNAQALNGRHLKTTPGLAVGSYFIPIYNLYVPFQSMYEIVECTFRHSRKPSPAVLIGPWWFAYILSRLSSISSLQEMMGSHGEMINLVSFDLSGILICLLIARITSAQAGFSNRAAVAE